MEWRNYIFNIFKVLDTHEATNELLRKLDRMIISDAISASNIFFEAEASLKKILNSDLGAVDIKFETTDNNLGHIEGVCINSGSDFQIAISRDSDDISYIRRIVISPHNPTKLPTGIQHPPEIEQLEQNIINAVVGVGQQLNVCIKNEVSRRTANLYRKITGEFAKSGLPQNVFRTICEEIKCGFFPDISIFSFGDNPSIRVQLLIYEKNSASYIGEQDILQIVGSTEPNDLGGYVQLSDSVTGSLFQPVEQGRHQGYFRFNIKGKGFVQYYLGNPSENSKYKKTMSGIVQQELAVLLLDSAGNAFAVLNIESDTADSLTHLHALTLARQSESLGELVANMWEVTKNRNEMFRGLFYKLEDYLDRTLVEFRHELKSPQSVLSGISMALSAPETINMNSLPSLALEIKKVNSKLTSVQELLETSVEGLTKRESLINLKDRLRSVSNLVAEELKNDGIAIDISGIPDHFPALQLDNLFSQFLYDILQNSIDAIVREQRYRHKQNNNNPTSTTHSPSEPYTPIIRVCADITNNSYTLTDDTKISSNRQIRRKCMITISDNGMGIEESKLELLAIRGNSFRGGDGTGYGLYGFKQYLSLFNGILLPFESGLHIGFTLKFVVNCIDTTTSTSH